MSSVSVSAQTLINTYAGNGVSGFSGDGGPATSAELTFPRGVAVDASGNLYIADGSTTVRKVSASGVITIFAGTPGGLGFSGDGGAATSAELNQPCGIAVDAAGNVYIADAANDRIRKVNSSGIITTVAGSTPGYSGDGGPATTAQLNQPIGLALDALGNIYIGDFTNNVVRKVDVSTGNIYTVAGNYALGAGYTDGVLATNGQINGPHGLAVDASGNIFIADQGNNAIRVVLASNDSIFTAVGNGIPTYTGDGGLAENATINFPSGIAVNSFGYLFIVDQGNEVIRVVNPSGIISTYAGNGTSGYSGDGGPATSATFNSPQFDAINNATGTLYISDASNYVVREVLLTHSLYFTNGSPDSFAVCENSSAVSIDNILAITDTTAGDTVTWSVYSAPAHGIVAATYSVIATGGNLVPVGLSYTPNPGYSGTDTFAIEVTNGYVITESPFYVTVSPPPTVSAVSSQQVCNNSATAEIDFTGPVTGTTYSWTNSDPGIGLATSGTGNIASFTAVNPGISIDTSSIIVTPVANGCAGTADTFVIIVAPTPVVSPISNQEICNGNTTSDVDFSGAIVGTTYSWTNNNTSIGLAASGVGNISSFTAVNSTSIAATATVTVTPFANGCVGIPQGFTITVDPTPVVAAITATVTTVCTGSNITLSDPTTGGVWSSSNANALVTTGGIVHGVTAGLDTISYTVTNTCGSAAATQVITINSGSAGVITGTVTAVCIGSSTTLSVTATGGTWSAANGDATVSTAGVVHGVTAGADIISYSTTGTCSATATYTVTVNANPSAGTITSTGSFTVCVGSTIAAHDGTTGGVWATTNSSITTLTSAGANATIRGISGGVDSVKYTVTNSSGCSATAYHMTTIKSLASVTPITGTFTTVCAGSTITFTDTTSEGVWSTSNSRATVTTGGVVTGVRTGLDTVYYRVANTCNADTAKQVISIDSLPVTAGIISGSSTVCVGSTIPLTETVPGGTWSDALGYVSITTAGEVTGVSVGTDQVIYSVTNSCGTDTVSQFVTVNPSFVIGGITGLTYVCPGGTINLTDTSSGGSWTTYNSDVSVSSTGIVTGSVAGVDTVYYTASGSCGSATTSLPVTVIADPVINTSLGSDTICNGSSTLILAVADTTTTTVSLLANNSFESGIPGTGWGELGPDNVYFSRIDAGESTTPAISAAEDGTYFLKWDAWDAPAGDSAAIVSPPFSLAGITNSTITFWVYREFGGGYAGGVFADEGFGIYINTTTTVGGTRLGFVPRDATSNIAGSVSGTSTTTTSGWYQYTCSIPASYTGTANYVLFSAVSQFGDNCYLDNISVTGQVAPTGITWSPVTYLYADAGLTTPYTSGTVLDTVYAKPTGITSTTNLTYNATASNGNCATTNGITITVKPDISSSPIVGANPLCIGSNENLTDANAGGTWSASNGNATITTGGFVTGVAAGADTITYLVAGTCGTVTATAVITINTVPSLTPISGTFTVCPAAITSLSATPTGGTWSSTTTSAATISTSGVVTGIATGTSLISYSFTNTCGTTIDTATVTVNPLPDAGTITGTDSVCVGATTPLSDLASGGSWISSNNAIATVGATSGIVSGISAGNVTIDYSVSNSCGTSTASTSVKVNALPNAGTISGASAVCNGSNITLTDPAGGGTWSSSNTTIATVNTGGMVTGVGVGSATISYIVTNSCGTASVTAAVTVNPIPNAGTITGAGSICAGNTVNLADDSTGGIWSSANPTIATVGAGTGIVQGISMGTATISYSITQLGCTGVDTVSIPVGVPAIVPAIGGPSSVCLGSAINLTDSLTGGTWSSSNVSIASVDPVAGVVTGMNAGSAVITYTGVNSCGSGYNTKTITVNDISAVSAISGATNLCQGDVTVLSDAVPTGKWTSSNTALATIDSVSGQITTIAAGTDTVTYSVTNSSGCITTATAAITINAIPAVSPINGASVICSGSTTLLSDTTGGGAWSSSNSSIANVNSVGLVLGNSSGVTAISYTITNSGGCSNSAVLTFTVNPEPGIAPISGASSLCAGNNTLLTDLTSGGTWSSSNNAIASVTTSGSLTGIMSGTVTVSYSVTNTYGCTNQVTTPFTVNPIPVGGSITGPSAVCIGSTITLADAAGGGVWSSSNPVIASIDSVSGILTPLSAPGSVTVTYLVTNVCGTASATTNIILNPLPVAGTISGPSIVCPDNTIALTDSVTGGVWSSSDNTIASIDGVSGILTGIGTGTVTVTYAVTTSCGTATTTDSVSVNPLPQAITGITTVCSGQTTTLSDATPGGDWVSADPFIANVNTTSGLVGGIAAGTTTISYNAGAGCTNFATIPVTVNALPSVSTITGSTSLCGATTADLSDATSGGVWSSSNTAVATISNTGIVTGLVAGTTEVAYTVTNDSGCSNAANKILTVNAITVLSPISGTANLCIGTVSVFTDTAAGGSWSSSDDLIAYIDPVSGDVYAENPGNATITYTATNPSGCVTSVSLPVTVNATPVLSAITGTDSACVGSFVTLNNSTTGGTWSSSDTTVASVNTSGLVTGISGGATTIGYTVTNGSGCSNTASVDFSVEALPAPGPVYGTSVLCQGTDVLLSDTAAGGIWSSSNDTIATVNSGGVVIGLAAGTATISYTLSNSCATSSATLSVTVMSAPSVYGITGATNLCASSSVNLSDLTGGGLWSASNSNASITTGGILTGNTAGIDTITYAVTNAAGCASSVIAIDTINALPVVPAISGASSVCAGTGISLSDTTPGGVWSTSNTNATITTGGVLTGNTAGIDTVTYSVTNTFGCVTAVTSVITINPQPVVSLLADAASVCVGSAMALSDTTAGGVWSSSNTNATITTAGIITGNTAGTDTITYAVTNGCGTATTTLILTVNPLPVVDTIAGATSVCAGSSITLTDDSTGGVWSASNGMATITGGTVSGVTTGIDTISYTITNGFGCTNGVTTVITVNPLPSVTAISGSAGICIGATNTFTDTTTGGVWSSSDITIASVDGSGNVTGVGSGIAIITYSYTNSCGTASATSSVTVSPVPAVGAITGASITCSGVTTTLSDTTGGGVWSSSDTSIAKVSAIGVVTGISTGSTDISYTVTNSGGCSATVTYTISIGTPIPASVLLPTVSATLCHGNPVNLAVSPVPAGVTFQWEINGDIIASATAAGYTADSPGIYTVLISNGTCSETVGPTTVQSSPHAVVSYNTTSHVLFTGSFATYQWYYNGSPIIGAESSILSDNAAGSYYVVVSDGNGCYDTSAVYIISSTSTGVNNVSGIDVQIYPNPASSVLQINAPVKVNVLILSLDGKVVIDRKDAGTIDVSNLANGMYLVKVYDENNTLLKTDKFAKVQ